MGGRRRRHARLRLSRGLAAARLVARGGARYATNAPRLFATARRSLVMARCTCPMKAAAMGSGSQVSKT